MEEFWSLIIAKKKKLPSGANALTELAGLVHSRNLEEPVCYLETLRREV